MDTLHALNIKTPLARVPESFIFGEGLDTVDRGKLNHWQLAYISFHKGDIECHHRVNWVGGELERDNIEVIK